MKFGPKHGLQLFAIVRKTVSRVIDARGATSDGGKRLTSSEIWDIASDLIVDVVEFLEREFGEAAATA